MSKRVAIIAASMVFAAAAAYAATPAPPKLGRPATPDEIARIDISIPPDGKGLPAGSGSVAQGAAVFAQKCAVCHGANAEGTPSGDRLVGGIGSLNSPNPVKTVSSYWPYATTVFDYVRRTMPWNQPKTLTSDETYAVVAYVLNLNGIVKDGEVLNKDTLPKVRMPNRDGFIELYPNKF
jgi:cytochrome c